MGIKPNVICSVILHRNLFFALNVVFGLRKLLVPEKSVRAELVEEEEAGGLMGPKLQRQINPAHRQRDQI